MQKQLYNEYIQNSFYLVKKFPMCRILIFADINPMEHKLSCCSIFGLGKNFFLNLF